MSIKIFEYYHGAVLTKLVRNNKPVTLTMVENDKKGAWCEYKINDEIVLYTKYCSKPIYCEINQSFLWRFTFNPNELEHIFKQRRNCAVYTALVCGQEQISLFNTCIGFIQPYELDQCISVHSFGPETLNVQLIPTCKLRIWGNINTVKNPLLVAQNRLENWVVPGR